MQKRDENQTFLGKSSVDSLPIHKYLFGETILDVRAFYAEGEDRDVSAQEKVVRRPRFHSREGDSHSHHSHAAPALP